MDAFMNILHQVINIMSQQPDALYIGELVALLPYSKEQIMRVMETLVMCGYVSEQRGFVKYKYFLKETPK